MSSAKKGEILSSSLSSLIEKFSQSNVIEVMEREYQSAPTKLISASLIDDNSFVSNVPFPASEIERIGRGLASKGFYNPLIVREKDGGRYEIILGRKRYLSAKEKGILSLPCVILEAEDQEVLLMLLADTRDQKHSNVLEMAIVCKALQEKFGYTQQMLAELSHQSRTQITNTLRILRLPEEFQKELAIGNLTYGHAKAIASLEKEELVKICKEILDKKLSVRETEALVKRVHSGSDDRLAKLKSQLGCEIEGKRRSLTFHFESEEEKNEFLASLLKQ